MKKQTLLKIMLVLMPVLAVGLATTSDSVMVFDRIAGTTESYSYFTLLPAGVLQSVTPLAAILCILAGGFAIGFVTAGSRWCITAVKVVSFAAASLAVLPILLQGDVLVVPNVGVPVFMMVQYALAYVMGKKAAPKAGPQGPRLGLR